ncbi:MAG: hypothetical protein ACXABY_37320 [Candidatus Thorarchaeota archaeon]|jgi:hypothetical protein
MAGLAFNISERDKLEIKARLIKSFMKTSSSVEEIAAELSLAEMMRRHTKADVKRIRDMKFAKDKP